MKKLLATLVIFSAFAFVSPPDCQAQLVKKVTVTKDSTVSVDVTYIPLVIDATVKSVEFHATKVSGTVAGKAYLQGSVDGTNWDKIDSLTYADQAVNYKVFPLPVLNYASYRFQASGTGSNKIKPIVGYVLRRTN